MARVSLKITLTGTIEEAVIEDNAGLGGDLIDYVNALVSDGSIHVTSSSVDYDQTPINPE